MSVLKFLNIGIIFQKWLLIKDDKNKENKNMMEEDSSKYGEFISSYFAWKTLDEQKKISEKLADITEDKKE